MKNKFTNLILSIAGSDNSAGAGIQADIKTSQSLRSYCFTCITAITSQNSESVVRVVKLSNRLIESQIQTIIKEHQLDCVKIGLVKGLEQAKIISKTLKKIKKIPIVVDPIFKSSTKVLFNSKKEFLKIYKVLASLKPIFTPNLLEMKTLLDLDTNSFSSENLIDLFYKKYKTKVVLTDAGIDKKFCEDFFLDEKNRVNKLRLVKINSSNTHGTGCTFSTSLAIHLSRGYSMSQSVLLSKKYTRNCIKNAPCLNSGYGPVGHLL